MSELYCRRKKREENRYKNAIIARVSAIKKVISVRGGCDLIPCRP
jgi:hypothetical protein